MSILARFDIRTLLACQLLLSTVFAIVFFSMKLAYRNLHGIGSIALSFTLGAPGLLLLTLRGSISDLLSIVVANALVLSGYLSFYLGVLHFFGGKRKRPTARIWIGSLALALAVAVIAWFSMVEPNIVPRIVAATLCEGLLCALIAAELLRHSRGRTSLSVFAAFILLHTAGTIYRAAATLRFGAPDNFLQFNSVQVLSMISAVVFVSCIGVFSQLMIAGELNHRIEHRANHDPVTGTLNRFGIETALRTELDRASRNGSPLSAVLIDIDEFKAINDSAGHAAGDEALRTVAKNIATCLRSYDLLGRFGGDEFLLLLPGTSAEHALEVSQRVRTLVAIQAQSNAPALRPTVSIGIAENLLGDAPATILARADAALYDAKLAGRNCIRCREISGPHPVPPAAEAQRCNNPNPFEPPLQA